MKAQNDNIGPEHVNDKGGNPIEIGVVVVWQIQDTYKALFDVENYRAFVEIQA